MGMRAMPVGKLYKYKESYSKNYHCTKTIPMARKSKEIWEKFKFIDAENIRKCKENKESWHGK